MYNENVEPKMGFIPQPIYGMNAGEEVFCFDEALEGSAETELAHEVLHVIVHREACQPACIVEFLFELIFDLNRIPVARECPPRGI